MKKISNLELIAKKAINSATLSLGFEIPDYSFNINKNQDFGDYSTNIAILSSKKTGMPMNEIAESITLYLLKNNSQIFFSKINVEKNGFINFWIAENYLRTILKFILEESEPFAGSSPDKNTYIVEFSSPNMVKPFSVGYLRSTIIGDSISRILTYCGKNVIRDNHLGDWGAQFGGLLLAINKWSNMKNIRESGNPYQELLNIYLKFIKEEKENANYTTEASIFYKNLEKGDTQLLRSWKEVRGILLQGLSDIYSRLDINFDNLSFESEHKDGAKDVVKLFLEKGVAKRSEGAIVIVYDNLPPLLLEKSDGSTLYGAREISCDMERKKVYGNSLVIINEVGNDQQIYLKQIFEAEKLINLYNPNQRIHLSHGMYNLDGIKMVSEKNNYLYLSTVLDYAKKSVLEKFQNLSNDDAEIIAQAAIRFNDLKNTHDSNVIFNIETFTSGTKGTGPYIQYTIHRIRSIIRNSTEMPSSYSQFIDQEIKILRHLQKFSKYLEFSLNELSCHYIAQYATELALLYNNYYSNNKILRNTNNSSIVISKAVEKLLVICLKLLGISLPSKM